MDEYDITEAFRRIEEELMASIMRNMGRHRAEEVKEGFNWSMWQAEQLRALEKYKQANRKRYGKEFRSINREIDVLIREHRAAGNMDQEIAILNAIKRGFKFRQNKTPSRLPLQGEFFKLNDRKLGALIKATTDDMERAETAILRMADDEYRKAIFNAQAYANTGAGTYEQAVDMATKDMLSRGLTCVEYANGARHTLSSYASMALRTAGKRAYLAGEGEMRQKWGIATVIVNKRGNPCPKCLPFCGKVLIDDVWSGGSRKDGGYPLMSTAIAAGLYHPNCRDVHTTYFPGISTADDTWTEEELEKVEEAAKLESRQQYARRQQGKFDRLARYSLDEEDRRRYQIKAEEWKGTEKSFSDQIDLGRMFSRKGKRTEKQAKVFYQSLLDVENDDIYQLLQQSYDRVEFRPSDRRRSYFSRKDGAVYLAGNAGGDTIAHELFHEIDRTYGITESGMLRKEISADYARLRRVIGRKDIQDVLYLKYPDIFEESLEVLVVKPEYRGISDILNGMSGGKIYLGYYHPDEYWEKPGALQRETWAQYGRMYYSGNPKVLMVLKDIFPETTKEFERVVKAVMK